MFKNTAGTESWSLPMDRVPRLLGPLPIHSHPSGGQRVRFAQEPPWADLLLPQKGLLGTQSAESKDTQGQVAHCVAAAEKSSPGTSRKGLKANHWPHGTALTPQSQTRSLPVPGWQADSRGCQGGTCQQCGQLAARVKE